MNVVKLTSKHIEGVQPLFFSKLEYMGSDSFYKEDNKFEERLYQIFCDTYLTDLQNFHAFGVVDNSGCVLAFISFYESVDDASWYLTNGRSLGKNALLRQILDAIMEYNEKNGRLKFYTLINANHARLIRRLAFSKTAVERYDYFDEYIIEPRCKTFFSNHWEILFKRSLLPVTSLVRCTFLKQKYRTSLPNSGNI
jgi:hypothetical protein